MYQMRGFRVIFFVYQSFLRRRPETVIRAQYQNTLPMYNENTVIADLTVSEFKEVVKTSMREVMQRPRRWSSLEIAEELEDEERKRKALRERDVEE